MRESNSRFFNGESAAADRNKAQALLALRGVSLTIKPGEFVAIMGPVRIDIYLNP